MNPSQKSHATAPEFEPVRASVLKLAAPAEAADAKHRPTSHVAPSRCAYDPLKRALDLLAGVVLLAVAWPILLAGWLLVKATSSGPGIYTQTRLGLGGRPFRIYKLRTMTDNCEATSGGAKWSPVNDPRVTPVGRLFRKLHVDELPQLFNVVAGDMSLVGPRPERPEFVGPLSASIREYPLRLAVRPGVTGLAQIQLPPDTDLDSVRKKVVLDRCYIDSRGLWFDLKLLAGTAIYLAGFSYAAVRRLLALPDPLGPCRPDSEIRIHSAPVQHEMTPQTSI